MSNRNLGATVLSVLVLGLCVACGDDTASGDDAPASRRRLRVTEALELCAVSPVRFDPAFDDGTLFRFRGVLTLDDGAPSELELGPSQDDARPGWVPFDLRTAPDGTDHVLGSMGDGAAWVEDGVVPSNL